MSNDTELLRQYADQRSESAFTELVRQHLNLVYSAALREMAGDTTLAEDLSQAVFSELAAKAQRLLDHPSLAGWLYTTVRLLAANLRRSEHRRRRREEKACSMNDPHVDEPPEVAWQRIRPALDDALHELNEADRSAVVLRFLEERSLRDVGASLGLNENTARMRVERALDKLRTLLARRGITATTSGLTAALAVGAITQAPSALAATIATTALAGGAVTTSTTLTVIKTMSAIKLKVALVSTLIVAVAVPVWQQQQRSKLETENAQLRQQTAELAPLRAEVSRLRKIEVDHAELDRLAQWKAQAEPELLRLRGKSGVTQQTQAQMAEMRAQMAKQQAEGTNQMGTAMGDMMKNLLGQQVTNKVARMTELLKLSPDQAQGITEVLMRQAQVTTAGMQQVFSGKPNKDEFAKLAKEGDPEEKIKALLTSDQLEGYKTYKQEENANNAHMAASAELMQMQPALGLTPDQQERVVSVLSDLNTKQLNGAMIPPPSTNQGEAMRWMVEQKVKALEGVLTPAQIENYRQQQELQLKFVNDVIGKMAPASPR